MEHSINIVSLMIGVFGALGTFCLTMIGLWLRKLIETVDKNTVEVAVLNSKIVDMIKSTERIPKLEQDVNALHEWKRGKSKEVLS